MEFLPYNLVRFNFEPRQSSSMPVQPLQYRLNKSIYVSSSLVQHPRLAVPSQNSGGTSVELEDFNGICVFIK